MLKARSRKLSLVLVLAMLMTMFAGLGAANAATGYSASHVPLVSTDANDDMGSIIVTFDNLPACSNAIGSNQDHQFIVKLPSDFIINSASTNVVTPSSGVGAYVLGISGNQAVVEVYCTALVDEVKFAIDINAYVPDDAADAINATIIAQPGSVFADGIVQVAKTASGAVTALAGDAVTVTAGGGEGIKIYFRENKSEALKMGDESLTVKLPKGFEWDAWDFRVMGDTAGTSLGVFGDYKKDTRTLEFNRRASTPAKIWVLTANIEVDEATAAFGDIEVTIGGSSNISPSSVIVGKYADYGVEVVVDDPETEVLAGRYEQQVSDFSFEENIADSLLDNRTIYVELPDGVEWYELDLEASGGIGFDADIVTHKPELLKMTLIENGSSKGKIEITNAEVAIAGTFTGEIKAKIWGNAGISEEVVLAKVIAPISASADIKDIKIGVQKQAAGNIVITEAKAEAIDTYIYDEGGLSVALPFAVTWGNVPTVTVIEGDIELGTVSTEGNLLYIPIETTSSKASKIEISDITYTADRTVPEGEMKATFGGDAVVQTYFVNRNYIVKEVVANCVTPAPGETVGSGEFKIGSNIYYAAGVAKVMDVAPYIKNGRTYVPMRYLGEILGAEVVWDAAAKTVTLTRGDVTVVFTVGSTSYTVNGEAKTADVAPEIVGDRTMLPARYVAEAFGAVVGWDPATQTVLIQK